MGFALMKSYFGKKQKAPYRRNLNKPLRLNKFHVAGYMFIDMKRQTLNEI